MFDSKHYIPILKWKRAEQKALEELSDEDKKNITPLIQFVMPKAKAPKGGAAAKTEDEQLVEVISTFETKIPKIYQEISKHWGTASAFIDVSLLYTLTLKIATLERVVDDGNRNETILIPVLNLSDDQKLKDVIYILAKKYKTGLCLRLVSSDLIDIEGVNEQIKSLLKMSGLTEKDVDLLVDVKEIEAGDGKLQKCAVASQKLYNLSKWRTFIFASGAFPTNLSQCKIDEENLIPRLDWKNWKDQLGDKGTLRKPSFADYTIQHPIYKESSQFFHPTTSIKYALEDDWLIMKGKKQKFEMYLASAKLLSEDNRFCGENFSYGDKYIAEKAKHYSAYVKDPTIKGTGGTESWLMVGINHHLKLTARQVANLP